MPSLNLSNGSNIEAYKLQVSTGQLLYKCQPQHRLIDLQMAASSSVTMSTGSFKLATCLL